MTRSFDIQRFKFYLWVGLAFSLLYLWHDSTNYNATFLQLVANNVWRTTYIIAVNFIFYEYTVPFVLKKRRYIIYNVLLAILLLLVYMMLWSFGLYAWRLLGTALHIYTPLIAFKSVDRALEG